MRYLFFAAIVWLVIWFWRRSDQERTTRRGGAEPVVQSMVQCAHCGIYLPLAEALGSGAAYYCCLEHREASEDGKG